MKKIKPFQSLFLAGSLLTYENLLAEDNGWYMSVGYQIGGTKQLINNKQLLDNEKTIASITQSAINIAGPTTGLITLSSQTVADALGYGVSNAVGNQLEGVSNILDKIGRTRKDFYSSRQISSISQQLVGLKGSSNPLRAHSAQITAKLLANTQSAFEEGIVLSSNITNTVNSLNPSDNTKEVKAQLQNTAQSMAKLLEQIEGNISKTTTTTYVQALLTNLTAAVNKSNNEANTTALQAALNTFGVGVYKTGTTATHTVLNPPSAPVGLFNPMPNSILGLTQTSSNNTAYYNDTLLMNTLTGSLSENQQSGSNGCSQTNQGNNQQNCQPQGQIGYLEQFIKDLNPLATYGSNTTKEGKQATPNNQNLTANQQQIQTIAQRLQSIALNTLDNNAINITTYNLNNLHNALNFQAYKKTIANYNKVLKSITWNGSSGFNEPKDLLKNTSNNNQIGTVTNAQGQNISAYDCTTIANNQTGNDAQGQFSCKVPNNGTIGEGQQLQNNTTNPSTNALIAASKITKSHQIGVNSFNLVSQVWDVYSSLKTSEENLTKNAKILCAPKEGGTQDCNGNTSQSSSGGLSISGNGQLQTILSTSSITNGSSNPPEEQKLQLQARVGVNSENAKTQLLQALGGNSGVANGSSVGSNGVSGASGVQVNNLASKGTTTTTTTPQANTVVGALDNVLANVNQFQKSISEAFKNQESNIQKWANAIYFINGTNGKGSESQQQQQGGQQNSQCNGSGSGTNQDLCIQLRANFYQLINTINQQVPTSVQAMVDQSPQQTQQVGQQLSVTTTNGSCANGTSSGQNNNWCHQQWSDPKNYYSGLQQALGYSLTKEKEESKGNSTSGNNNQITYNVQKITLTSNGLLQQIIAQLKSFNGSNGEQESGKQNNSGNIGTAYQMLIDASEGKLGNYTPSSNQDEKGGSGGSNNGYTPCTRTQGASMVQSEGGSHSSCYTPNKNTTQQKKAVELKQENQNNNLQKIYDDAKKIADIIASSGNNKGVENGLKQFFEALKGGNGQLSNLCSNGSSSGGGGGGGSQNGCTGGLINLLGAIPTSGVSDTNNLVVLLTEFIKTAGFIQNQASNQTDLKTAFNTITQAISKGFQALQNDISPNVILTLLQEITSNTTTIQSFSQTLRQLLGDNKFFSVQQKLLEAMVNARNQVQNAYAQASSYGANPILSQYVAGKSTQHGMSNGVGASVGYKYFFGKARNLGLRHYLFVDYGYSEMGVANQSVKANIFAYGLGTDFLWNLFRRTYHTKALNFGLFTGIQLGGTTWLSSLRQQIIDNWGDANNIHLANFQVALNFGVRTNFAEFKRFSKNFHNQGILSQKSVEFGIKVPFIDQVYLKSAGADVNYRRLYTFYINYITAF
ncbi:outer membrane protein [Helicobacter cetorum]|nr:outer membrane protein [Helicobacter cetorum]